MEKIEAIDRWAVTLINSFHSPFMDELMWIVSAKLTWVPLYVLLIYLSAKRGSFRKTTFFILCAILVVAIADQTSVHLFKNVFMRYRPSHNALLTNNLHFYQFEDGSLYKGGMYGFVSSHAANFFGVLTFATFVLKDNYRRIGIVLISIAIIVSISRVYLGVHYVSDITVGALLGIITALLIYKFVYKRYIGKEFFDK